MISRRRRFVSYHFEPGLFWLRVFGRGFYLRDIRVHPPTFSERNGYARGWLMRRLK